MNKNKNFVIKFFIASPLKIYFRDLIYHLSELKVITKKSGWTAKVLYRKPPAFKNQRNIITST
ncbi:MAG TPA: hypothetical protein PLT78_10130, partial [Ignavibacteriaceae bacterium]|nr:hypothetical protein [Ignavibacteriaceae bacterium]